MDQPAGPGRIRASDAERERVARYLAAAFTDGRLDLVEYDLRVARAYAAVYRADLEELLDDLPAPDEPLFDRPATAPVRRAPAVPVARRDVKRPYGWPAALVLFAIALCLARVGFLGPSAMLLLLAGLAIALNWVSNEGPRKSG